MKKDIVTEKVLKEAIRQVCFEFKVSPKELFEAARGKENLLQLIVISLVMELSESSPRAIARMLSGVPVGRIILARDRLGKYLQFVPGLENKYEKIKTRIIKKVGEF